CRFTGTSTRGNSSPTGAASPACSMWTPPAPASAPTTGPRSSATWWSPPTHIRPPTGTPKRSSTTPTAVTTAPTCADASPPCCWAWPPARFAPSIRTGPTPPRRGSSWRGAGWPRLNDADALDEKSLIFGSPIPHLRARWWTSRGVDGRVKERHMTRPATWKVVTVGAALTGLGVLGAGAAHGATEAAPAAVGPAVEAPEVDWATAFDADSPDSS